MSELRQVIAHHETRAPVDRVARVLDAFAIELAGSRAGRTRAGGGAGASFKVEELEQRARQYLYGQRSSGVEPADRAGRSRPAHGRCRDSASAPGSA
jgi:hypothetical protein